MYVADQGVPLTHNFTEEIAYCHEGTVSLSFNLKQKMVKILNFFRIESIGVSSSDIFGCK